MLNLRHRLWSWPMIAGNLEIEVPCTLPAVVIAGFWLSSIKAYGEKADPDYPISAKARAAIAKFLPAALTVGGEARIGVQRLPLLPPPHELRGAAEDRAGLPVAELHDRQHRIAIRRDIEDRSGDDQGPGPRHAVRLALVQNTFAARAARVIRPGHADEATGLAADRAREARRAAAQVAAVKPLPHRLAVERRVHPDEDKGQRQQRIDAGREPDRHQIAEFHIGDEHAEHEDFE